jgi:hypothetical protein
VLVPSVQDVQVLDVVLPSVQDLHARAVVLPSVQERQVFAVVVLSVQVVHWVVGTEPSEQGAWACGQADSETAVWPLEQVTQVAGGYTAPPRSQLVLCGHWACVAAVDPPGHWKHVFGA